MELLLTLVGNDSPVDLKGCAISAVVGSILTPAAHSELGSATDAYLMEVEDEGASTLRNKSIFFVGELLEQGKQVPKIIKEYLSFALGQDGMEKFWSNHGVEAPTLPSHTLYLESALFLLYSYTDAFL